MKTTITRPTEYRFTSSVFFVFGLLGLMAVAATLIYSLQVSQRNLEQEIEQSFSQRHMNLKTLLESRLDLLDVYLNTTLSNRYLGDMLQEQQVRDRADLDDILFHFRDSAVSDVADLFFILDPQGELLLDASSHLYPVQGLVSDLDTPLIYTGGWRFVSHSDMNAFLKAAPIFKPGTLELRGYLFSGLVLAANPELQEYLFERMDVDFMSLFESNGLDFLRLEVTDTSKVHLPHKVFAVGDAPLDEVALKSIPLMETYLTDSGFYISKRQLALDGLFGKPLVVYLGVDQQRFVRLKPSFWMLFMLTGGGFLIFLLMAGALFHWTHEKAIGKLMDYIRKIHQGTQVLAFQPTRIYEYNRIGEAMESMVEELKVAGRVFESGEGMLVTDAEQRILRANDAFTRITGYSRQDVQGKLAENVLFPRGLDPSLNKAIRRELDKKGIWLGEVASIARSGQAFQSWLGISAVHSDADGRLLNYVVTLIDVTEKMAAERKIRHLAYYDQLTGLANRQLLLKELEELLNDEDCKAQQGALVYLDMDDFKTLNDTQGHQVGDSFLQLLAERLKHLTASEHRVARVGGDEFMLLIKGLDRDQASAYHWVEDWIKELQKGLAEPFLLAGIKQQATMSIGITLFTVGKSGLEAVMQEADLAMYQAKSAGRNTYRFFSPQMLDQVLERAQLIDDLRRSIKNRDFLVYYQPQVNHQGKVTGAEALVRWSHPERGMVSPVEFIPIAEETDLILELGQQVLETACEQLASWSNLKGCEELTLAVNISARQFQQADFVQQVSQLLKLYEVNPQYLKLEITESLLMDDEDIVRTTEKMLQLQKLGVSFSLDDFGTGYSSLTYLKKMPLDQLKIDKSFVDDLMTDGQDQDIVRTIVALGQSLRLSVIAEGVETQAQKDCLESLGCYSFQGYCFGRPLPIEEFHKHLNPS